MDTDASIAAAWAMGCVARHGKVGPGRHCSPRHPKHFEPLSLELNPIIGCGEQYNTCWALCPPRHIPPTRI